jgi:hypothetical protein
MNIFMDFKSSWPNLTPEISQYVQNEKIESNQY